VYGALNRLEGMVCERVFYPEPEDLHILRERPGNLISLESQRPVQDFDLLFFSIPFENDYTNVVEMLHFAGIPPHSEDRSSGHPLVAAGGVAVFLNPEPLAPFLDFVFIGEAEAILPDFHETWEELHDADLSRKEVLARIASEVAGVYVPSLYAVSYRSDGTIDQVEPASGFKVPERVAYRRADLAVHPPCQSVVLTPNTEFSNVTLLEIGRGCGRGCRFCAAGFVYRPVRYHAPEKLLSAAEAHLPETARVGLVSAAVSDHPHISTLCESLIDRGGSLSFSSLRADSITPEIMAALKSSKHQAVAIAPEAGSERLRQVINKGLTLDQIYAAAEKLTESGVLHLKLYFMIGLPTETLEDLQAIVDLAKGVKHHVLSKSRGQRRLGVITLSVHSFVPKPFTPFQWVPFAGIQELKERARWVQKALRKVSNVRVHFDVPKWAYVQALLARGDRRTAPFLERVALDGLSWTEALKRVPFNPDFWVMRERCRDELFPWEVIDHGLKRQYLWDEYQRALQSKPSPACRPEDTTCRRCGVCGP
jgi:radical SAM superfamily enzyme YgiQ (UPF0313 family)